LAKGYLLDTSVVSVLAPGRASFVPTPLSEWLQAHHKQLYLPCIAIAEMAQGIGKLRRVGRAQKQQGQGHVLRHVQVRQHMESLKHKANLRAP